MPVLTALTISIGGLAVVATWAYFVPLAFLGVQIWQGFVAWASFYHCGGKVAGLKNTIVCMGFGAIVGALSVWLAGSLGALGALAAPVAVGIGAAVLVLGAHLGLLATIPASVYGFACIAGLILLKGMGPFAALLPTLVSVVVGALFGWVSEYVGGLLTKKATASA
jgi:hypothetical protein